LPRLALAVGDSMLLGGDIVLRLDRIHSANVARHGGRDVLLYRVEAFGAATFLGLGCPKSLTFDGERDSDHAACELRDIRRFAEAVPTGPDEPCDAATAEISDARFAEIVAAGTVPDIGFAEAAEDFILEPGPDVRAEIYRQVLERWDYRCAVTGERFPGATAAHHELEVVAIQPRDLGGPLHVRNYLPMVAAAARLWKRGLMSVTDDLQLVFAIDSVPPELLRRIPSGFRLITPERADLGPDPAHLRFYRQHVFGRAGA